MIKSLNGIVFLNLRYEWKEVCVCFVSFFSLFSPFFAQTLISNLLKPPAEDPGQRTTSSGLPALAVLKIATRGGGPLWCDAPIRDGSGLRVRTLQVTSESKKGRSLQCARPRSPRRRYSSRSFCSREQSGGRLCCPAADTGARPPTRRKSWTICCPFWATSSRL